MTDKNYPVPVPFDLVNRLAENSLLDRRDLVLRAYQEGANAELDACCEQLRSLGPGPRTIDNLRAARRPKPKSQAEEALKVLDSAMFGSFILTTSTAAQTIRAALERLRELEGGND